MIGAHSQSLVVITAYRALGLDALVSIINESGITAMLCNLTDLERIRECLGDGSRTPTLRAIIYTTHYIEDKVHMYGAITSTNLNP